MSDDTTGNDTKLRNEAKDAAAMILAVVTGDDDRMVDAVILEAAMSGDVRVLARLLHWTVSAAAGAIKAECVSAAERGEDETASVTYLVGVTQA